MTSNALHFRMLKQLAELLGRQVASPAEYREIIRLGLTQGAKTG